MDQKKSTASNSGQGSGNPPPGAGQQDNPDNNNKDTGKAKDISESSEPSGRQGGTSSHMESGHTCHGEENPGSGLLSADEFAYSHGVSYSSRPGSLANDQTYLRPIPIEQGLLAKKAFGPGCRPQEHQGKESEDK